MFKAFTVFLRFSLFFVKLSLFVLKLSLFFLKLTLFLFKRSLFCLKLFTDVFKSFCFFEMAPGRAGVFRRCRVCAGRALWLQVDRCEFEARTSDVAPQRLLSSVARACAS